MKQRGLCEKNLLKAVPTTADWKLSGVPYYLTKVQLEASKSFFKYTPVEVLVYYFFYMRYKESVLLKPYENEFRDAACLYYQFYDRVLQKRD